MVFLSCEQILSQLCQKYCQQHVINSKSRHINSSLYSYSYTYTTNIIYSYPWHALHGVVTKQCFFFFFSFKDNMLVVVIVTLPTLYSNVKSHFLPLCEAVFHTKHHNTTWLKIFFIIKNIFSFSFLVFWASKQKKYKFNLLVFYFSFYKSEEEE